jgi:hypothetical protein
MTARLVAERPAAWVLRQLSTVPDLSWVGVLFGEGGGVVVYLRHHAPEHVDALLYRLAVPLHPLEVHDGRGARVTFAPLAYLSGGLSVDWVCDDPATSLVALLSLRTG